MILFNADGRPLKRAFGFQRYLVPDTSRPGCGGADACGTVVLEPDEDPECEQATNERARQTPSPDQPAS
jgi:hypothetical protein